MISGSGTIPPPFFEMTKKVHNQFRSKLLNLHKVDGGTKCIRGKGQEERKGIAVALDRIEAAPFDLREILLKKMANVD